MTAIAGYRLSPQQARIWRLQAASPAAFRAQCALLLEGELEAPRLAEAVAEIVARHQILTATFHLLPDHELPIQRFGQGAAPEWREMDLRHLAAEGREARLDELFGEERRRPFDLETGPALRATLLRLADRRHVLLLAAPALCADARTLKNLIAELDTLLSGKPVAGEAFPYVRFAEWQHALLADEQAEQGRAFWRRQDGSRHAELPLPFATGRSPAETFEPEVLERTLSPELVAQLDSLAARQDTAVAVVIQVAWQMLLWRLSGQATVVVGAAFDGRELAPLYGALGLYAKWLPVGVRWMEDLCFEEVLRQVDRFTSEAYEWQGYFVPAGDLAVGFDYEERPAKHRAANLSISVRDHYLCADRFALRLSCGRTGGALSTAFYYCPDCFRQADVLRLGEQLETLLADVVDRSGAPVGELAVLSEAARRRLLVAFNDTAREPLPQAGFHHLFEEQADRAPQNIAVACEGRQLTYAELEERANRLAHCLRRRGVGPEAPVALCLERSEEMVVALLGVLKAGGAYLPLDPVEPRRNLAFVLADARPKLLVTRQGLLDALPEERPETVLLDGDREAIVNQSAERPASRTVPEHLLYVIYTSGSTGRPKGVMIAHRQMLNYILSFGDRLDLPPGAGYAMVSTFAADLGNTMLYLALASGGCLHVVPEHRVADPAALAEVFERHRIDVLKIVPSHLAALMTYSHPQRILPRQRLVLGGEALRWEWIEEIRALAPDCVIFNSYGPTETTVAVMTRRLEHGAGRSGAVPLGRPIANTRIYVLDRRLRPQPVWVPGELHVGGVALSRGYLDRPALTAERFVPDPWSSEPGGRLYKTGDLSRHLPEGTVELLGRIDHQIKLRGFRIELGEIEAVLAEHPGVRQAVVTVREDPTGDRRLAAYVVATGEPRPAAGELRDFLRERLSEHMVPAAFVPLWALPLTPNGKVDRHALPAPEEAELERDRAVVAPRDELELQLTRIWQELLGVQPVGIDDDFFELGGHSLLAVTLMARIESTVGKRPPLTALLQRATVENLARVLRQETDGRQPMVVKMQPRGSRPPFFCVHPAGGGVLSYLDLARRLAPDRPFYALQGEGGGEAHHRVEDLAAHYAAVVLETEPRGPYFLGGHSFGGVVAYEMAQKLTAQGHEVALLALIDSTPMSPGDRPPRDREAFFVANFALHLGLPPDDSRLPWKKLAKLGTDGQLAEILSWARDAGLLPGEMEPGEARRRFELLKSHIEARWSYVPRPYPGRVTLLRASKPLIAAPAASRWPRIARGIRQIVRTVSDPKMGWGELAAYGVEVHEIPGNHFSIFRPPHVTHLAAELRACLDQAHAKTRS